jgi:hypothetical protein
VRSLEKRMGSGIRLTTIAAAAILVVAAVLSTNPAGAGPTPAASTDPSIDQDTLAALPRIDNCGAQADGFVRCNSKIVASSGNQPDTGKNPVKGSLTAQDIRSAYRLSPQPPTQPAVIGIIDAYDDPSAESDMAAYRKFYNLPSCTTTSGCFRKINQNGTANPLPKANKSWSGEISLDLDMVSAACTSCHIILVEANSPSDNDMYHGVDAAIAAGATVLSLSWGSAEFSAETENESKLDRPGVQIVASAGDDGYGTQYPAASQHVTSVGGTILRTKKKDPRGWTETVWPSSGGGCTKYIAKPSWQSDAACGNRTDNDISAVAQNLSVYDSQLDAKRPWTAFDGTSASAPIVAGAYAFNGTQANGGSGIYQAGDGFYDILTGKLKNSNKKNCKTTYLCQAGAAYDAPTGRGTPDGTSALRTKLAGGSILIFGDTDATEDASGLANLTQVLQTSGYTVTYSATLPPNLSQYSQVWWYGIDALAGDQRDQLINYAKSGGSLYLTGEWNGCCATPSNDDSVAYIFDRLIVTVGGLQFGPDTNAFTYDINGAAIHNAANVPTRLTTFTGSLVGGISPTNLGTEHFLSEDSNGDGVIGLWNTSDVVGGGRLVIVMDVNWAQTNFGDMNTMPGVAQNIAYFLSGATTGTPPTALTTFNPTISSKQTGSTRPAAGQHR